MSAPRCSFLVLKPGPANSQQPAASLPTASHLPLRKYTQKQPIIMKTAIFFFLLISPVFIPATANYAKLLSKTAAKKSVSQSLASWARKNSGNIASRSITSLISTLGLIGALEAVRLARESASPSEQSSLDDLLTSLTSMSDTTNFNPAEYDGIWVALGGLCISAIVMILVAVILRCGKCKKTQCDLRDESCNVNTIIAPEIMIESPTVAPAQGAKSDKPVTEITIE